LFVALTFNLSGIGFPFPPFPLNCDRILSSHYFVSIRRSKTLHFPMADDSERNSGGDFSGVGGGGGGEAVIAVGVCGGLMALKATGAAALICASGGAIAIAGAGIAIGVGLCHWLWNRDSSDSKK
jgi:hypothetical protein